MTEVQAPYAVVEWPTPTPEPCAHCDAVVPVKGRVFLAIPFIPVGIDITGHVWTFCGAWCLTVWVLDHFVGKDA